MTVEDLMIPKYKVIADYPNCKWKMGRILVKVNAYDFDCLEAPTSETIRTPEKYPHLFKRLAWYEDRELSDMPEYVKFDDGKVVKPFNIFLSDKFNYFFASEKEYNKHKENYKKGDMLNLAATIPATEQDYLTYLNPNKHY